DVMDDTQPLRTIVADDDPLVRRLIRDTLQMDGVTVIAEASNGREAVELALFYRPDVVVMDYMMPEMDGIEATRRLYEPAPCPLEADRPRVGGPGPALRRRLDRRHRAPARAVDRDGPLAPQEPVPQ